MERFLRIEVRAQAQNWEIENQQRIEAFIYTINKNLGRFAKTLVIYFSLAAYLVFKLLKFAFEVQKIFWVYPKSHWIETEKVKYEKLNSHPTLFGNGSR